MADEFERQVETLIETGYPALIGLAPSGFRAKVEPLRAIASETGLDGNGLPFIIVVPGVEVTEAVERMGVEGVTGFKDMSPEDISRFQPIEGVDVPEGLAYLITDVDTGRETLNVAPDEALARVTGAGRSPLTIQEGLAVLAQYPDVLKARNAFSMAGSRAGDKRVPALWTSRKQPRLGWCWAGNPHTWLGTASCAERIGMAALVQ